MQPGLSVPTHLLETDMLNSNSGGLIDKPGKNVDPYHTCYALSGLSVSQHSPRQPVIAGGDRFATVRAQDISGAVWGNELADIDPRFNIVADSVAYTTTYFRIKDAGQGNQKAASEAELAAQRDAFKPSITASNSFASMATNESQNCLLDYNADVASNVNDSDILNEDSNEDALPQICTSP